MATFVILYKYTEQGIKNIKDAPKRVEAEKKAAAKAGITINESLPTRTNLTLDQLDADFAAFARKKAEAVAPGMTWDDPDLPASADSKAIETWLEAHPKSFPGLRRLARQLVAEALETTPRPTSAKSPQWPLP